MLKCGYWVKHAICETKLEREVLKLERRQNVKKCVEENRDKGEIKKTKGEEDVAEKKTGKKKRFCVCYTCGVGQGHEQFFFFFF